MWSRAHAECWASKPIGVWGTQIWALCLRRNELWHGTRANNLEHAAEVVEERVEGGRLNSGVNPNSGMPYHASVLHTVAPCGMPASGLTPEFNVDTVFN